MTSDLDRMETLRSPIRMRIMATLVQPHTVAQISARLGIPVTGIYHHLRRLEAVGLVEIIGRERRGRSSPASYRATVTDINASMPALGTAAALERILEDAARDASGSGNASLRRISRTVAAVPPDVASAVADLLDSAAETLRRGDRDDPEDELVSLTFVLAPLAPIFRIHSAEPGDIDHLRRVLYEAVAWNPQRQLPPMEMTVAHPELARYHEGWGRAGDLAVLAEADGAVVGGALCRLFTAADHGHGFIDEATPELAVAVWPGHRGTGLGTRLLEALEAEARRAGFERISLSVDADNPARRLYLRCGYETVAEDDGGVRMVKAL